MMALFEGILESRSRVCLGKGNEGLERIDVWIRVDNCLYIF